MQSEKTRRPSLLAPLLQASRVWDGRESLEETPRGSVKLKRCPALQLSIMSSWLGPREDGWAAPWRLLVSIRRGAVWWGVGAGRTSLTSRRRTEPHFARRAPLPASQTWSGTGSAAWPGRCRHPIPSPLGPLGGGSQKQSASPRCGKLKSTKTGCCSAVWGSLPSLLPLVRT